MKGQNHQQESAEKNGLREKNVGNNHSTQYSIPWTHIAERKIKGFASHHAE